MYSVVLPIKTKENGVNSQNYVLLTEVGLPSFEKFWRLDKLKIFYLVCLEEDMPLLQEVIKNSKIPYKIVSENSLNLIPCKGWYKQQLIKLKMAEIIETPYYLILDSDHFLTRDFSYSDMFEKERLKYSYEPWQTENNHLYSTNSRWWENSCRVLNFPVSSIQNDKHLMGVTPQVLITNIVLALLEDLGKNWQEKFIQEEATEFTLYWLYVLSRNYTNNYTTFGKPLWKHDLNTNILVQNQDLNSIRNAFSSEGSFFSVIQGYLHLDNRKYIKEAKNCLSEEYLLVFLLPSVLIPHTIGKFKPYERYQQILENIRKLRERFPKSFILLVEGSAISDTVRIGYQKYCDKLIELGDNPTVVEYTKRPNIGHGELKLLEYGLSFLRENILPTLEKPPLILKMTPRYSLTSSFDPENYSRSLFTLKAEFDTVLREEVYTTKLYSIPVCFFSEFEQVINKIHNGVWETCIEKLFHVLIPREKISVIPTLGLEGRLSYNGEYFSI